MPIHFNLSPDLEEIRAQTRGYSKHTPLADGADEVHQMRIAHRTIAAYQDEGSARAATGNLPL